MQSLSWFDFVTVAMVGLGIWVGRRRGMSGELLDLILWVAIVVLGALVAPGLGQWLSDVVTFSPATGYILAYLILAATLYVIAVMVRRWAGDKLVSGDLFGGLEYYLGMTAGVVHFLCILLAFLAVVHAPRITEDELNRKLKTQRDDLGEIYFPPFGQIQQSIFRDSITGRTVKQHLTIALLKPSGGHKSGRTDNIYRARERLVDDAAGVR
jgi:uncharacterized membrane protein required for colicin V production